MRIRNQLVPRLPVMGWRTFRGPKRAVLPCLLDHAEVHMTTSGRAAILLAMERLGLKPGDKVLVPTYHCPTMIAPVVALGAEPVFYPIDAQGAPQLDWLQQQPLDGIKIILAAHYFGLPQPMQALRRWCDTSGVLLIEDCAHALFGVAGERAVGHWGDAAIGSLTKFLPVTEGGCLHINTTKSVSLKLTPAPFKEQLRAAIDIIQIAATFRRLTGINTVLLAVFALRKRLKPAAGSLQSPCQKNALSTPSFDGCTIDSALSHRALTSVSTYIAKAAPRARIVEKRRDNFNQLTQLLSGFKEFHPLVTELPAGAAPYVYPLWVATPDPGYAEMRRISSPVSRWDRMWPSVPPIAGDCGPNWSHHILQLACHQDLDASEIQGIANTIKKLFSK